MTDSLAIVRRRLHDQRLAGDPFASPAEAVAWLGAVQAQELAEAKWSLGERVRDCSDADVEDASSRGEILRTHVLRPTWHFVAPADIRWLLRLTAPRVHKATSYSRRRDGLDGALLSRSHDILAGALRDSGSLTRPELGDALRRNGIEAKGSRLSHICMHAELEQLMCSGPRRGKQHTYALLDDRAPSSPELSHDQALAELALRYFRSHGPATLNDFTWWSGLTRTEAKKGIATTGDRLHTEEDEDGTAWLSCAGAAPDHTDSGAFLLPMYDELGIAYQDLRMFYAAATSRPQRGLMSRPVVIDGECVGSWRRTLTAREVVVEVTLFTGLDRRQARALEGVTARFGSFLGLPATLAAHVVV
ncbi:MAG: winged helix DNA-binding domain-containing protein [Thermoleophilaceae bacterium]